MRPRDDFIIHTSIREAVWQNKQARKDRYMRLTERFVRCGIGAFGAPKSDIESNTKIDKAGMQKYNKSRNRITVLFLCI